jgi:hypothetical protein
MKNALADLWQKIANMKWELPIVYRYCKSSALQKMASC